jgi:hypothetical protein
VRLRYLVSSLFFEREAFASTYRYAKCKTNGTTKRIPSQNQTTTIATPIRLFILVALTADSSTHGSDCLPVRSVVYRTKSSQMKTLKGIVTLTGSGEFIQPVGRQFGGQLPDSRQFALYPAKPPQKACFIGDLQDLARLKLLAYRDLALQLVGEVH